MTQLKQYQRDAVATVGGWLDTNLGNGRADRFGLLQAPTVIANPLCEDANYIITTEA